LNLFGQVPFITQKFPLRNPLAAITNKITPISNGWSALGVAILGKD